MGAVYIDGMQKITTLDVPHVKATIGRETWLMAKLPEGDYAFHKQWETYHEGYGSSVVDFLMQDGMIESFKGPFHQTPDEGDMSILEKKTGITDLRNKAVRIVVGTNIASYLPISKRTIVFEDEFSTRPFEERLKPEWRQYEITVWGRTIGRCFRANDLELKELFDKLDQESQS